MPSFLSVADPSHWLIAGVIVFLGSCLQGLSGVGLGMVAAPILLLSVPQLVPGPLLFISCVISVMPSVALAHGCRIDRIGGIHDRRRHLVYRLAKNDLHAQGRGLGRSRSGGQCQQQGSQSKKGHGVTPCPEMAGKRGNEQKHGPYRPTLKLNIAGCRIHCCTVTMARQMGYCAGRFSIRSVLRSARRSTRSARRSTRRACRSARRSRCCARRGWLASALAASIRLARVSA